MDLGVDMKTGLVITSLSVRLSSYLRENESATRVVVRS